jgi:hypothetical protein
MIQDIIPPVPTKHRRVLMGAPATARWLSLTGTVMAALKFGILEAAMKATRHAGTKNAELRKERPKPSRPSSPRRTAEAYYEGMQHAPPADRLAELMEYLSERLELEAENNKAK